MYIRYHFVRADIAANSLDRNGRVSCVGLELGVLYRIVVLEMLLRLSQKLYCQGNFRKKELKFGISVKQKGIMGSTLRIRFGYRCIVTKDDADG